MEVLLPLCVIWGKAIKDFCTDFHQERMWVPWETTHQLIKSNQAISCSELILGRGQTDKGIRVLYGLGLGPRAGPARGPWAGPGFNDILRAGPGAGLKLAGPGRARAGK